MTYLCTSCHISFQDGQEQRVHMKAPWHVYNIKRRIASLPPITLETFDTTTGTKIVISKTSIIDSSGSSSDEEVTDEGEQSSSPFQCLFCSRGFASDDAGFETNLDHMRTMHGMSIPDPEMVIDMQSFVGYLAMEIRVWHECIYCGSLKPSTLSIQSHMRHKGHCQLNLDREPELLDFWENPRWIKESDSGAGEQEQMTNLSAKAMRLASGRMIGSRHDTSATKKTSWKKNLTIRALPSNSEDAELPPLNVGTQLVLGRQLARRDEMSTLGVPMQQRQALVVAEKKAQRNEAVARRAKEWVSAKASNSQKFDQADNQMKWGKQNHKLLPR